MHGRLVCASGVAVLGRADRHGTEAQGASDILEQRPGGDDHFQRHVHACSPRCVFMYVDNFQTQRTRRRGQMHGRKGGIKARKTVFKREDKWLVKMSKTNDAPFFNNAN